MASAEEGLTGAEAARRLVVYSPNEAAPVRRLSAVVQLFRLFANPLVTILLVACAFAHHSVLFWALDSDGDNQPI